VEVKEATEKEVVDETTTKVELVGKGVADEVAMKVVEEAERKKKEDTLNNYDSPMDTNIGRCQ
jgi:predicted GNAT family acetyltransferase